MRDCSYEVDVVALRTVLTEADLTVFEFCRRSGLSNDTVHRVLKGKRFVTAATAAKMKKGLASVMTEPVMALVLKPSPRGSVKILGDADTLRVALRKAAQRRGLTTFRYMLQLFTETPDPLAVVEADGRKDRQAISV